VQFACWQSQHLSREHVTTLGRQQLTAHAAAVVLLMFAQAGSDVGLSLNGYRNYVGLTDQQPLVVLTVATRRWYNTVDGKD